MHCFATTGLLESTPLTHVTTRLISYQLAEVAAKVAGSKLDVRCGGSGDFDRQSVIAFTVEHQHNVVEHASDDATDCQLTSEVVVGVRVVRDEERSEEFNSHVAWTTV